MIIEGDTELYELNISQLVREGEDLRRRGALHCELANPVAERRHRGKVRLQDRLALHRQLVSVGPQPRENILASAAPDRKSVV